MILLSKLNAIFVWPLNKMLKMRITPLFVVKTLQFKLVFQFNHVILDLGFTEKKMLLERKESPT